MKDIDIIEKLNELMSKRPHVPSRKLCALAVEILRQEYEVTDKKLDTIIKDINKTIGAVTLTCSTRFKVKLDIIEYALGESR